MLLETVAPRAPVADAVATRARPTSATVPLERHDATASAHAAVVKRPAPHRVRGERVTRAEAEIVTGTIYLVRSRRHEGQRGTGLRQGVASASGSWPGRVAPRRLARIVVTKRPCDSTWTSIATGPTSRANVVRVSRFGSRRRVSTTTQFV